MTVSLTSPDWKKVGFNAGASFTNLAWQYGIVDYGGVVYPTFRSGAFSVKMRVEKVIMKQRGDGLQSCTGYAILRGGAVVAEKFVKVSGGYYGADVTYLGGSISFENEAVQLQTGDEVVPVFKLYTKAADVTDFEMIADVTDFLVPSGPGLVN